MLTIADIPDEYRRGKTDGENISRLASGVQTDLGESGMEATKRLVQAAFHFRTSEIGREMVHRRDSTCLREGLGETAQLVEFAGGVLAATSLAAAVDLAAAAVRRLYLGPFDPANPGKEADLDHFGPGEDGLPGPVRAWIEETRIAAQWRQLKGVRNHVVHRWFPVHVTITLGGPGPTQQFEVEGERHSLDRFLADSRAFVIDRLLAVGLLMVSEGRPSSSTPDAP